MFWKSNLSRKGFFMKCAGGLTAFALSSIGGDRSSAKATDKNSRKGSAGEPSFLPFRLISTKTIRHNLTDIRGLVFDGDKRLYAACASGVTLFDDNGLAFQGIPTETPALAVEVDDEKSLFVAERTRVTQFDRTGKRLLSWGEEGREPSQFSYITAVALSGGMLYIADAGNRRVHRYAVNGDYVDEIEGFNIPSSYFDCQVDKNAVLHVGHTGEHKVERYNANGKRIGSWGEYGSSPEEFCGCCNPTNLALFTDGKVATTEKGIPRLKVYDSKGEMLAYLSPEELGARENESHLLRISKTGYARTTLPCHSDWPGMPLAIDTENRLAVSVPNTGEIRFFEVRS